MRLGWRWFRLSTTRSPWYGGRARSRGRAGRTGGLGHRGVVVIPWWRPLQLVVDNAGRGHRRTRRGYFGGCTAFTPARCSGVTVRRHHRTGRSGSVSTRPATVRGLSGGAEHTVARSGLPVRRRYGWSSALAQHLRGLHGDSPRTLSRGQYQLRLGARTSGAAGAAVAVRHRGGRGQRATRRNRSDRRPDRAGAVPRRLGNQFSRRLIVGARACASGALGVVLRAAGGSARVVARGNRHGPIRLPRS